MAQSYAIALQKYREWMEGESQNLTEKLGLGFHQVPGHHLDWMKVYFMLEAIERKRTEKQDYEPLHSVPLGLPSVIVEYEDSAPLDEIIKKTQRLVITGGPGSGKTTSLLYLLSMLLQRKEGKSDMVERERSVPVFLQLKQIAPHVCNGNSLSKIVLAEVERCGSIDDPPAFLSAAVQNRTLWLLMDGMDEVPASHKEKVFSALADWLNAYRDIPCVLTSRPGGMGMNSLVGEEWRLQEYALRPIKTNEDTIFFMEKWLAVLDPQRGRGKGEQLFRVLNNRVGVKKALRNPLLVRMLVDLYHGGEYQMDDLPWSRSEIYENYITGPMLRQANISDFPQYEKDTALRMLEYIAWYVHGVKRELSQEELIEKLRGYFPGEEHWEAWFAFFSSQMRIMIALQDPSRERGGWMYAFSHRTFQEYFLARKLATFWRAKERGRRWVWRSIVRKRLWDSHWREVILLLCSIVAGGKRTEGRVEEGEWYLTQLWGVGCGTIRYGIMAACFDEGICCSEKIKKEIFRILLEKNTSCTFFIDDLLLKLDQSKNDDEIKKVIDILGKIGDERAVEGLLAALQYDNPRVASSAAEALGKIGNKQALGGLLVALQRDDARVASSAVWALGKIGNKQALGGVLATLQDGDAGEASRAAWALGEIGDERAVEGLLATLQDGDAGEASRAAWALGEIGDERALEGLLAALQHDNPRVASSAAEALGEIGDERAIEGLLAVLQREYPEIASRAAWALGKIGNKQALGGLLVALQREDLEIALSAVWALGEIGDERAVEGLLATLQDGDAGEASRAAWALGEIRDERAVEGLLAALQYDNPRVASSAAEALGKIGNKQALEGLLAVLQREYPEIASRAAWALGEIGDERAIEGLLAALRREDPEIASRAVEALGKIGDERAVEGLLVALQREDPEIASRAAWALGEIGDERAIEGLLTALRRENPGIAYRAAWALGKIGNKQALEGLLAALRHEYPVIAYRAAWALGEIGDERAIEGLLAALRHEDGRVAYRAAWALGKIGYNPHLPEPELPATVWKKVWDFIGPFIIRNGVILIVDVVLFCVKLILDKFIDRELIISALPQIFQKISNYPLQAILILGVLVITLNEILRKIKK